MNINFLCDFVTKLARFWRHVGRPGRVWGYLGASWARLGASWRPLGASLAHPVRHLARLGASWARLGRVLGASGHVMGASWRVLARKTTPMRYRVLFVVSLNLPENTEEYALKHLNRSGRFARCARSLATSLNSRRTTERGSRPRSGDC